MRRSEAIAVLAKERDGAISVAAMQAIMAWHAAGQAEADHLDALGCMGSASSIGLGLALARPERRVVVLDGDGCLLMQLGSLITIAAQRPENFYHVIFENGRYETSGNQALPGFGVFDLPKLALAAGYRAAWSIDDARELQEALPRIFRAPGPTLIRLAIAPDEPVTPWPRVTMNEQIRALRSRFGVNDGLNDDGGAAQ
ncbi:MAG: thiamine pyrophosphate-dependent enzyme [Steroidobacteraceae bacterium]